MNKIKALFISTFYTLTLLASAHCIYELINSGISTAWLGALIAVAPPAAFLSRLLLVKDLARTSANLLPVLILSLIGAVLALWSPNESVLPMVYATVLGALGSTLYIFWYSRLNRDGSTIQVGAALPNFTLQTTQGEAIDASTIRQTPALMLFYRGNWCPLCMAQIREVAELYKELDKRGVKVYLIGAQSEKNTEDLAKQFNVPMSFLIDKDLNASEQLGILHKNGTPVGMLGYETDTIMPTAILTDDTGKVIFADLTDNYRVRPEPQTFLDILDATATA